ncbi:hypothetical protein CP533_1811 [Ophiocordyceps camponoti-saundersi (nom. inval.)]|nr:hypothetical protein CP533_1811 [Ophiocordyceps camponoti-saundersi (nom. inval.)]
MASPDGTDMSRTEPNIPRRQLTCLVWDDNGIMNRRVIFEVLDLDLHLTSNSLTTRSLWLVPVP